MDNRQTDSAEAVLRDLADTLARMGAYVGGAHSSGGLVLGPEHAQLLGNAGYSRADVQQWLFEHAVRDRADLVAAGKVEPAGGRPGPGGAAFPMLPRRPGHPDRGRRARPTPRCRWSSARSAGRRGRAARSRSRLAAASPPGAGSGEPWRSRWRARSRWSPASGRTSAAGSRWPCPGTAPGSPATTWTRRDQGMPGPHRAQRRGGDGRARRRDRRGRGPALHRRRARPVGPHRHPGQQRGAARRPGRARRDAPSSSSGRCGSRRWATSSTPSTWAGPWPSAAIKGSIVCISSSNGWTSSAGHHRLRVQQGRREQLRPGRRHGPRAVRHPGQQLHPDRAEPGQPRADRGAGQGRAEPGRDPEPARRRARRPRRATSRGAGRPGGPVSERR